MNQTNMMQPIQSMQQQQVFNSVTMMNHKNNCSNMKAQDDIGSSIAIGFLLIFMIVGSVMNYRKDKELWIFAPVIVLSILLVVLCHH